MTFRNICIWIFDEKSNVLSLFNYCEKKCSKSKLEFLAENLRKFLCFVFYLTHFEPKKYTFIATGYQQVILSDIF